MQGATFQTSSINIFPVTIECYSNQVKREMTFLIALMFRETNRKFTFIPDLLLFIVLDIFRIFSQINYFPKLVVYFLCLSLPGSINKFSRFQLICRIIRALFTKPPALYLPAVPCRMVKKYAGRNDPQTSSPYSWFHEFSEIVPAKSWNGREPWGLQLCE